MSSQVRSTQIVFLLTVMLSWSPEISAQKTCVTSPTLPSKDPHTKKDWRLNVLHVPTNLNFSQAEYTTIRAAALWNEATNSGYFNYRGSTGAVTLPNLYADCVAQGRLHHLVTFEQNGTVFGREIKRCVDSSNVSHFSHIQIFDSKNGVSNNWGVDELGGGRNDLLHNVAHEFGHTLNLGHPAGGEPSLMSSGLFSTTRYRDVYGYDKKCAIQVGKERKLSGKSTSHSSGTFGSTTTWTGSWELAKGAIGVTYKTSSWQWAAGYIKKDSGFRHGWTQGLNTSNSSDFYFDYSSVMPRPVVWRDRTIGRDRLFWTDWLEVPNWNPNGLHLVRQRYSDNSFATSTTQYMQVCNTMTGWMTCSSKSNMVSGKPITVAWDDSISRSHTVWTRQTRNNTTAEREVLISTGSVSDITVPVPTSLGVQSAVSPGVACKNGAAGGYDCVVVYNDDSNILSLTQAQRFSAYAGSNRFELDLEGVERNVSTGSTTFNSIAVWYHNSYFWVALVSIYPNHPIRVFRSTNGATWSLFTSFPSSPVGPSAVSYWTGNNQLVWFE